MKKCLILGNASDRLLKKEEIKNWNNDLFICNLAFQEYLDFPKITCVCTVHDWVSLKSLEFKKEHNLEYEILFKHKINEEINSFKNYKGYASGTEVILECINRGYEIIYLCGFVFINECRNDIYTKNIYCENFSKQWIDIKILYPKQIFKFL
jgi:hypothetical protein